MQAHTAPLRSIVSDSGGNIAHDKEMSTPQAGCVGAQKVICGLLWKPK